MSEPAVEAERTENIHRGPVKAAVRYGFLGMVGEFIAPARERLLPSQSVLVETERGLEFAEFVCYTSSPDGPQIAPEQVRKYLAESGQDYLRPRAGKILRAATADDIREWEHIRADSVRKKRCCQEAGERLGLKMKIAAVEHLFGGERIIFYFTAEGRVDFRELVRELAREYQTRIELRQIGARDEARILGDYAVCGRQCCCKSFLKTLRPVSMKMAKLQKATLDPTKVSGRCGRLRCCLAYENRTYDALCRRMPKLGAWVQCSQGVGRVRDLQVLTQLVLVALEGNRVVTVPVDELQPARPPETRSIERPEPEAPPPAEIPEDLVGEELEEVKKLLSEEGAGAPAAEPSQPPAKRSRRRGRRRRRPSGRAQGPQEAAPE